MPSDCFHSVIHRLIGEVMSGDKLISIETGYLRTWDTGEWSQRTGQGFNSPDYLVVLVDDFFSLMLEKGPHK
jgi:hypothetical protein